MSELEFLQARDEILQAMYWMRSEGLASAPSTAELARFLTIAPERLGPHLERMAADGLLVARRDGWELSGDGLLAGKRTFADEFADMTRQGHGECDADCWCHDSPEEAARCLEQRAGQAHG